MFFNHIFRRIALLLLSLLLLLPAAGYGEAPAPVVIVQIKGEIDGDRQHFCTGR